MEVASRLFPAVALPCGHENPDDNAFCDVCGGSRPSRCPLCQAINRGTANFCGRCGVRLTELPMSNGALGSSAEARTALQTHGDSGEITVSASDTAVADTVSERPPPEATRAASASGPPPEPEPRVELESSRSAMAMDRSKDEVRPIEDLARSARVTRHQSSRLQSEGREPIRPDADETRADPRLEQLPHSAFSSSPSCSTPRSGAEGIARVMRRDLSRPRRRPRQRPRPRPLRPSHRLWPSGPRPPSECQSPWFRSRLLLVSTPCRRRIARRLPVNQTAAPPRSAARGQRLTVSTSSPEVSSRSSAARARRRRPGRTPPCTRRGARHSSTGRGLPTPFALQRCRAE